MYIVFAFYQYYPNGGAGDIQIVTSSLSEASEKCEALTECDEMTGRSDYDYSQVYDVEKQQIVLKRAGHSG